MVKLTKTQKLSGKRAICLLVIYFLLLGVCWLRSGPTPVFVPPGSIVALATVFANAGKAIVTNRIKGVSMEYMCKWPFIISFINPTCSLGISSKDMYKI